MVVKPAFVDRQKSTGTGLGGILATGKKGTTSAVWCAMPSQYKEPCSRYHTSTTRNDTILRTYIHHTSTTANSIHAGSPHIYSGLLERCLLLPSRMYPWVNPRVFHVITISSIYSDSYCLSPYLFITIFGGERQRHVAHLDVLPKDTIFSCCW